MCLLSSVAFLCFMCRKDAVWFLCLVLKSVFCESDVCFRSVFALRVTVAWQITDVWRQFRPFSGQVFFCRQLQVLCYLRCRRCAGVNLKRFCCDCR